MKLLTLSFVVDSRHLGKGAVTYAWSPTSRLLVCSGSSHIVRVFERKGKLIKHIVLPAEHGIVSALEWDMVGTNLAIVQNGPNLQHITLYNSSNEQLTVVDVSIKEPCLVKWSYYGFLLSIGSVRGEMAVHDTLSKVTRVATAKHKKRITCGHWNQDDKVAFASEDRQITIVDADAQTVGQVKVKSKPTSVKFPLNDDDNDNMVAVSMDKQTLMLYNLEDSENALELAFQPRYGGVVGFDWFADSASGRAGYILVGFSQGYLVVISTHVLEVGREQFCARFFKETAAAEPKDPPTGRKAPRRPEKNTGTADSLTALAFCPANNKVALVGDGTCKIAMMYTFKDWKVVQYFSGLDRNVDSVAWSPDGKFVTLGTQKGSLFTFEVGTRHAMVDEQVPTSVLVPVAVVSHVSEAVCQPVTLGELITYSVYVMSAILIWTLLACRCDVIDLFIIARHSISV